MSNGKHRTSASTVLVLFLFFSLLNKPVTGNPLLGMPEEELPNFQSVYSDRSHLIDGLLLGNGKDDAGGSLILSTHGQSVKRNPGGQNHLSDALLRLLFINKKDDDDSADYVGTTDTSRTRLRFGKRSIEETTDNWSPLMG